MTVVERKGDFSLDFFEGIRVIMTFVVIWGHTYQMSLGGSVNLMSIFGLLTSSTLSHIINFMYSVDVFFFLSGFFIAFSLLHKQVRGTVQYLQIVAMRYMRLMPAYLFMIFWFWQIYIRTGDGPLWNQGEVTSHGMCSTWWRNALFIDTFFPISGKYCFPWGWYLSCDWWMFVISLPVMMVYKQGNTTMARLMIFTLILAQVASNLAYNLLQGWGLFIVNFTAPGAANFFDDYYDKIHQRWAVYFQGLYMGICFVEYKFAHRPTPSPLPRCGWMHWVSSECHKGVVQRSAFYVVGVSMSTYLYMVPGYFLSSGQTWSIASQQLYNCVNRPLFILGMNIALLPMMVQSSKYASKVLSCYFFRFMTKLTYPMYLIQLMVISHMYSSSREEMWFSNSNVLLKTLTVIVYTTLLAILVQAFIERPFATLVDMLLPKKKMAVVPKESNLQKGLLATEEIIDQSQQSE